MVKSPSRQSGDPAAHQPDTDAVSGLPAAAMAGTAPESFELALGELEQIVQRMEGGALRLRHGGGEDGAAHSGLVFEGEEDDTLRGRGLLGDDGEVLCRGPHVFQGYLDAPDKTAEALDDDGWLHSGDIGHLDADGFLAITDRKKELIVNAYGKNIAPAPIENALKASRFISQAVVIGDRRQFLVALLVPDFETLVPWAEKQGLPTAPAELVATPQVRDLVREEVEAINTQLARYEQVRNWALLPAEFTLETGELTPTQKVKRRVVNEKYGEIIERLYREGETAAGA